MPGLGAVGRVADWLVAHPKLSIGTLATAGFLSAHPFHPLYSTYQSVVLGDPNAVAKMRTSMLNGAMYNAMVPGNQQNMWGEITAYGGYGGDYGASWPRPSGPLVQARNTDYRRTGPGGPMEVPPIPNPDMSPGPSGNLVFGLYNNRMR